MTDDKVQYSTGNPTEVGTYACRVVRLPATAWADRVCEDRFLVWCDGHWCGQRQPEDIETREVIGWVGPLERLN